MPTAIALLNGKTAPARARFRLAIAVDADARARHRRWRRGRRLALGLLDRVVPGIGHVLIAAAIFQTRLDPVEFRRRRRHVGIGPPRGTVGLRRGAAEIFGVGGNVAEATHARRLGVVGAARTTGPIGRRQRRIWHIDRRRLRTRRE